jgi:hypothetical protein
MKKKSGFSLETHLEMGKKLHQMRKELVSVLMAMSESYPLEKVKHIGRILDELSQLRSDLDSSLFREFPQNAKVQIYYPGDN